MRLTDFSKLRIGADGRIHYFLYQQDGSKQAMLCPDTIYNRLFVCDPAAVERGRRGGTKGGTARAATLTPERRREIAGAAACARWAKK